MAAESTFLSPKNPGHGRVSGDPGAVHLASGVDVKTAQSVLGHAKASHTLDLYADSVPGNVDAAMEQLGEML
jgi:hypothetical protein